MLRDYHGMHVTDSNAGRLFKVCLSVVLSVAAIARGAIHTARSPEFKDVQSAVNSANDGDTVIVPGGTDTWSSTLTIRKNITLQGNGVGKTVILDGIPDKWDIGRKGQSNTPLVNVELSKDSPLFRLTGFEFSGAPGRTVKHTVIKLRGGSSSSQNPLVLGCTSNFRLDHCKFNGLVGMSVTFTDLLGLVDHVEYLGKGNFCDVQHPGWARGDMGHGSWADNPYWGTGKFLFFEDCDFTNESPKSVPYGFDAYLGARYVVRHCRFHGNTGIGGHGTETPQRGTKEIEIYNNSFDFPDGALTRFPQLRSGTVLFHDNTFRNCLSGMALRVYRQGGRYGIGWGYSNGMNRWDENDPNPRAYAVGVVTAINDRVLTDAQSEVGGSKNWRMHQFDGITEGVSYIVKNMTVRAPNGDPTQTYLVDSGTNTLVMGSTTLPFNVNDHYEVWKVRTTFDQPGQGKGALLTGNAKAGTVRFASNGAPGSWPQRGYPREPCYAWNNTNLSGGAGTNVQLKLHSEEHSVKEGRDFFNYGDVGDVPQKIGPLGSTYTYKAYTYPHPLQKLSAAQ